MIRSMLLVAAATFILSFPAFAETVDGPATGSYIAIPGEVIIESERDVSTSSRETSTDNPGNEGPECDRPGKGKGKGKGKGNNGKGNGGGDGSPNGKDDSDR